MMDIPFKLLDNDSEMTGLVCGIDGCSIETSSQQLDTPSQQLKINEESSY